MFVTLNYDFNKSGIKTLSFHLKIFLRNSTQSIRSSFLQCTLSQATGRLKDESIFRGDQLLSDPIFPFPRQASSVSFLLKFGVAPNFYISHLHATLLCALLEIIFILFLFYFFLGGGMRTTKFYVIAIS